MTRRHDLYWWLLLVLITVLASMRIVGAQTPDPHADLVGLYHCESSDGSYSGTVDIGTHDGIWHFAWDLGPAGTAAGIGQFEGDALAVVYSMGPAIGLMTLRITRDAAGRATLHGRWINAGTEARSTETLTPIAAAPVPAGLRAR